MTTLSSSNLSSAGATLQGSFSGASGTISETGFLYGTSRGSLTNTLTASGTTSPFTATLSGLSASTTYYYQAYVKEYNASTASVETRTGSVLSFTTSAASTTTKQPGYLGCYEVPTISNLSGTKTTGTNSSRDDKWTRYNTTNAKQQVAVHTYTHPSTSKEVRNYVVLYDESKYAPLWSAFAMNSGAWPDENNGRTGSWITDPAISLTQQSGLDNASTVGYSRGHLVASNYRQSSTGQNNQTFYYSNQAPQWQNNFNSGVWSTLENNIVSNTPSGTDTLYVVTGVLYEGTTTTLPSGSVNVPIPSHFYTCLMLCSFSGDTMTSAQGCAYLFTNEAHEGGTPADGLTTIDAVEQRAGFDFFPTVPSSLQSAAESSSTALW